jgi:hypothetical protein
VLEARSTPNGATVKAKPAKAIAAMRRPKDKFVFFIKKIVEDLS